MSLDEIERDQWRKILTIPMASLSDTKGCYMHRCSNQVSCRLAFGRYINDDVSLCDQHMKEYFQKTCYHGNPPPRVAFATFDEEASEKYEYDSNGIRFSFWHNSSNIWIVEVNGNDYKYHILKNVPGNKSYAERVFEVAYLHAIYYKEFEVGS